MKIFRDMRVTCGEDVLGGAAMETDVGRRGGMTGPISQHPGPSVRKVEYPHLGQQRSNIHIWVNRGQQPVKQSAVTVNETQIIFPSVITKYLVSRSKKYYDNVIIFQNSAIITLTEKSYQSGNLRMYKEGKKIPITTR